MRNCFILFSLPLTKNRTFKATTCCLYIQSNENYLKANIKSIEYHFKEFFLATKNCMVNDYCKFDLCFEPNSLDEFPFRSVLCKINI